MDCRESQQVISALFDGEPVTDAERADARTHCVDCAECARFLAGLKTLAAVPSPQAPDQLTERVLAAVQNVEIEESVPAVAGLAAPQGVGTAKDSNWPEWLTRQRLWAITGVAATAAVLLAVGIGFGVYQSNKAGEVEVGAAVRQALSGKAAPAPPAESATSADGGTASAPQGTAAASVAPDYLMYQQRVYVGGGTFDPTGSTVTTVGTVSSGLSSGGSPTPHPVLKPSDAATSAILVRYPDDSLHTFSPVARSYGGKAYALQSGTDIDRFGQWPTLPTTFNQPATPDGAPTFRLLGQDASGVNVYVPQGSAGADNGIAIAPGSPSTDPAAGNPNWTWWRPL